MVNNSNLRGRFASPTILYKGIEMSRDLPKVEKFEHIQCESITVKSDNGAEIRLLFDDAGQPQIGLSGLGTNPNTNQLTLNVNNTGSIIAVNGSDGYVRISLSVDNNGKGRVSHGTKDRRWAVLTPDDALI